MKKVIILMGVPGSGKGTQAEMLAERFNYGHISTGKLLRALSEDKNIDDQDKQMLVNMKAGRLVPDKLIYKLVFKEVEKHLSSGRGVILDGAIRNVEQAKEYQKFFAEKKVDGDIIVIDVSISDEVSLKRLLNRKKNSVKVRDDDNLKIIKKRIQEQGNEAIKPILDYYKSLGLLRRVDGGESVKQVYQNVLDILNDK